MPAADYAAFSADVEENGYAGEDAFNEPPAEDRDEALSEQPPADKTGDDEQ